MVGNAVLSDQELVHAHSADRCWQDHGLWSEEAQSVHHIRRDDLQTGLSPVEAMNEANRRVRDLGVKVVFCDGGHHDARWLSCLAQAAGARPAFDLGFIGAYVPDERPNSRPVSLVRSRSQIIRVRRRLLLKRGGFARE